MPDATHSQYLDGCSFPGGVLNVEIQHPILLRRACFRSGKTSELSRHLHFQNTTRESFFSVESLASCGSVGLCRFQLSLAAFDLSEQKDQSLGHGRVREK